MVLFLTKSFHSKVIPQCNIFTLDLNIKTPGHSTHERALKSLLLEQMKSLSFDYSVMLQTYKLTQCFLFSNLHFATFNGIKGHQIRFNPVC